MKNKIIRVGDKEIGSGRAFIVAEIGSNHGNDIRIAYDSIDAAKDAGADAVKFQSLKLEELYYRPSARIVQLHKKIDMPEDWHGRLKAYCDKRKVLFFSSPTYLKAVDILEDIGVKLYKLASAQVGVFPQIVRKVALTGKPVLLSTALADIKEIEKVARIFRQSGNGNFVIMHCNGMYPVPYGRINLSMMDTYRRAFGVPVGFSDHSLGIYASIAAAAKGASVIEKHFILNKKMRTPDAVISLDGREFAEMVSGIRAAEQAMKPLGRNEIEPEEKAFKKNIIYRIMLSSGKAKGEKFTADDFDFKRSPSGIDCRDAEYVTASCVASRDLKSGTLLRKNDIKRTGLR